ncbi:MAG: S8 family serine peptidase [Bacteroidales bacterium]|nr:S8 family serine peptidase [Bacteroidales bacterium]
MRKNFTLLLFIAFFGLPFVSFAQKYAVYFTDKVGTPYTLSHPEAFLSQRALERREKFEVELTDDDLPVNPAYVAELQNVGATVLYTSKWLNCAVVNAANTILPQITALDCVDHVVFVKPEGGKKIKTSKNKYGVARRTPSKISSSRSEYGQAHNQIAQLNGIAVHDKGYKGEGVVIAVLDSGFDKVNTINAFNPLFGEERILATRDFVNPGGNVYSNTHYHGTAVLSCMAAYVPNQMIGTAPEATCCLFRTEDVDSEYLIEEYNWVAAAEAADSIGADIINTSLSYHDYDDPTMNWDYSDMDGQTTAAAIGANKAIERGVFVCVSAGNSGGDPSWKWIGTPADVNNVLTVGAVDEDGDYVYFSSIGPNAAGEQKPNTMAQGYDCATYADGNTISYLSGTSFASPITCGMVACLIQAKPHVKPVELKSFIEQTGNNYNTPTIKMGYGIPDFDMALSLLPDPPEPPEPPVITNHFYAIHFTDKNDSPYSIDEPLAFLSQKSLDRRAKFNISLTDDDLPVNPDYIEQVKTEGAELLFSSRWINCALARIPDSVMLENIENLACVDTVIFVKPGDAPTSKSVKPLLTTAPELIEQQPQASIYGYADEQIRQLNGIPLHEAGYQGEDILIAILDAGFPIANQINAFSHVYENERLIMTKDFANPGGDVYDATLNAHGTLVMSCIASYWSGTMIGTAPNASFALFRTEDAETEYPIEEYNWVFGAEAADSIGADVINSSLGYHDFDDTSMNHTYSDIDGKTIVSSIAAQKAVDCGIFVCVSAGNTGDEPAWQWIGSPADASDILTVGAVNNQGQYVYFSSIGPNAAGDQKPNTMARGQNCPIIIDNEGLYTASGTSLSSPITAGMVACLLQMFPDTNPMELRDMIQKSANYYNNPTPKMGYGIPDFAKAAGLVSISEIADGSSIIIYPNPTSGELRVESGELRVESVEIFDVFGRNVSRLTSHISHPISIDISHLPAGVYFLRIQTENNVVTRKVIKN